MLSATQNKFNTVETKFTRWVKWQDRHSINGLNYPGVYAIAVTKANLINKSFALIEDIKYFGMTNSRAGLRGRLMQCEKTIRGKTGHGGADRFRFQHQDYDILVQKLFVSVAIFECYFESNTPQ